MNYRALIDNRKSVRAFSDKKVPKNLLAELESYFVREAKCLEPDIRTELVFFDDSSKAALEGAAGYNSFLVGAPQYLVLLSEKAERMYLNAGYLMEDLVLKLNDLGLDSCWVTFTDSEAVKDAVGMESELEVTAIVAFGYGIKTPRRLRLNILSMSNVDIKAKRDYMEPKRSVYDLVFVREWGNSRGLDDAMGFFDDMLWEAFHAAAQAPSYLNRQAYGFILEDGRVHLVSRPDDYSTELDGALSLGIVLHHFSAVASQWAGDVKWSFGGEMALPEGHKLVASCEL
jgi:nitroreductase